MEDKLSTNRTVRLECTSESSTPQTKSESVERGFPEKKKRAKPATHPAKADPSFRREEMAWLGEHEEELEKDYPGEWLAFDGPRLVAHGQDLHAVVREAKDKGVNRPFLSAVRDKEWQEGLIIRRWV